jgi:dTDP-4-amino-4,6-dideoxygalactose transaminase
VIPLHRPPFGIRPVIKSVLWGGINLELRRLEDGYAAAMNCPYAVWLPSARAGIRWALQGSFAEHVEVLAPAFTCAVVHEAVVRSRAQLTVVDVGEGDFFMPSAIVASRRPIVLCEAYGHPYDLGHSGNSGVSAPPIRIIDMAMSVAEPARLARLGSHDFAVVSFGPGKSMYTGWGGIGFARDKNLAQSVREARDATLVRGGLKLAAGRSARTLLRTLAHNPAVYSLARKLYDRQPTSAPTATHSATAMPSSWLDDRTMSAEWRLPATGSDRGLGLWNLKHSSGFAAVRANLAQRYNENLKSASNVIRPPPSEFALSHYTIRLSPEIRWRVKELLYRAGIYTVTLWGFLPHLDKNQFPNTFRLSSEVLNLPLSAWMSVHDVDFVCEKLVHCVEVALSERA